jgi:hypothetical protein
MSFTQGIRTINDLALSQSVTGSIVPVDVTGFTFTLQPGKKLKWGLRGVISSTAAGGIRLRANCTVAPANFNAEWLIGEPNGPTSSITPQLAVADVALTGLPTADFVLWAQGEVTAAATATVFSIQFAQDVSDASNITIHQGATLELVQY